MPHGAGHAGGHFGGGGGFHHHHHHHHRHHYGGGYGLAYGGPYYRYGYRRRSLGWGLFWLIVVGSAITLAVVFSLRYGLPEDNSSSTDYAPNETRAISYSSVFCNSISVNTQLTGIEEVTTGTLSVLSQLPPLSNRDSFNFSKTSFYFSFDYQYWNYYLYPESSLTVSACKEDSLSSFEYYLIQGENKFNSWTNNPRSSVAKQHNTITSCSSGMVQPFQFKVDTEGEYYMAFYRSDIFSGGDSLDISFDVSRTKYAINPEDVLSNCSLTNIEEDCILGVPLDYSVAVLELSSSGQIDWSSPIPVNANCNARIWVYVALSLVCVASFVLFVVCVVACCCVYLRRNKSKYSSLDGNNQPTPVVQEVPAPSTATYGTGNDGGGGPPPYNPSYGNAAQAPPPKYF